jgi:hypothetical protein
MSDPLPLDVIDALEPYLARATLDRVRVAAGPPWSWIPVLLRTGATTFGPYVLLRSGRYRTDNARGLALIAHEALHTQQYRELGLLRFLWQYLRQNLAVRFNHDRHPLEVPCIVLQGKVRKALQDAGWP